MPQSATRSRMNRGYCRQAGALEHAGGLHWNVKGPNDKQYTVTTDPDSYVYVPGNVEWFGPGSPAFPI